MIQTQRANAGAPTKREELANQTQAQSLVQALDALPPLLPRQRALKQSTINIRVAGRKKAEIKEIADIYGLSITDYLLQLHDHARSVLLGPKAP